MKFAKPLVPILLMLAGFVAPTQAQDISIPDPGLNAAIRDALQKPVGPLTQQDLLGLTTLGAQGRNVKSIEGLNAARNLTSLNLRLNHLTNFVLPAELTNLTILDVSVNGMTGCSFPSGPTNLAVLSLEGNALTNFTLPAGLKNLNSLDLNGNRITSFSMPSNLISLLELDLGFNLLTNYSLPGGLTNLNVFLIAGNPLTNLTLPGGLRALTQLNASQNQLTKFILPAGMTNLIELDLFFNQLTNLTLPNDLRNLGTLDLDFNRFSSLNLPTNLTRLASLKLYSNQLTTFNPPSDLKGLTFLDIGENQLANVNLPAGLNRLTFLRVSGNTNLTSLALPAGMTNLLGLFLRFNQLTNLTLPADLGRLVQLDLLGNKLANFTLPAGLTNLVSLILSSNELTSLTLPPDVAKLSTLVLDGNPLTTLVLSEPLAANLAVGVDALRDQGVSVYTYPLMLQLIRVRQPIGAFQFAITGPPGDWAVLGSTNLLVWDTLRVLSNPLGTIVFTDATANFFCQRFYRVQPSGPPTNMVFIPPTTFTMGTPVTEANRQTDEGPQTTVIISHGFCIGKYEVTQRDYQAVMGSNPSGFPGDLNRPVESVSWLDATNYCAKLTQQELAAGRIAPGSHFRLPTEAEWECAARAGSSTRFSYGDDPNFMNLTNNAWFSVNSGFGTHPVGRKNPNPWGLYDMEGNVLEWCQDWYGPYAGGAATDPQGPASNANGVKVVRGGAWDSFEADCRSGCRLPVAVSPFIHDFSLGFRVVFVTGL